MIKSIIVELEASKPECRLGKGWISGVLGLFISSIVLIGISCQRFPQWFTTPEIRSAIAFPNFKLALIVGLVLAFGLGCISLILRQFRWLGMTSVGFVLLAMIIGIPNTSSSDLEHAKFYLGMDWFVLNLALTGILFLPLERLFQRVEQSVFRFEWREDLFYFFISSILIQSLTYLTLVPSQYLLTISKLTSLTNVQVWVGSQHFALQLFGIMFFTDLVQYWVHRLFHQIPALWKFHAVHHSAQKMDWLAGSRMHIIEIICLRAITVIPTYLLGFDTQVIYTYLIVVYLYSTYIHANLRFDVELIKPVLVTPRFHHWHHGVEKEAIDVNFSIHFPIFDRIFGTYHMPKGKWPTGYGVGGHPVPQGCIPQFIYPFQSPKKKNP